jgi:hypothetical protein
VINEATLSRVRDPIQSSGFKSSRARARDRENL